MTDGYLKQRRFVHGFTLFLFILFFFLIYSHVYSLVLENVVNSTFFTCEHVGGLELYYYENLLSILDLVLKMFTSLNGVVSLFLFITFLFPE